VNPQEFHLSITPLGDDRYLIRTEDMAAGVPVAEAQVQWPVDQWLKRSQPAMDDPILGLLQGRSPAPASAGSDLNQLGAELYDALFRQEYIRESWSRAQGIAQNRREILRLRLGFKDSRLQRLPWEVLKSHGKPLATRVDLTFARYSADLMAAQSAHPLNLPEGNEALQVLMVIANPDDQARLNLRQEVHDIQASLQPAPGEAARVEITVLEQPDRSDLTQALEQGRYQVLHYAGHSDFGKTGGDLHLVNQQTGLTERLTGEDLAGLLVNNQICLAVFNSCRSGHTGGDDAEMDWRQQNLVQALVNRGVQSVIAMAERIPDQVAVKFTQLLYTNIKQGYPIDLSLGRTRQALVSAFGSDQHYWALPVLYLQPEFDGYLTQRDRAADVPLDPWQLAEGAALSSPDPETEPIETPTVEPVTTAVDLLETLTPSQVDPQADPLTGADLDLGQLVEQLSQSTAATDEPPIPADQGEVLLPVPPAEVRPDLYRTLPENPHYQRSPSPDLEPESDLEANAAPLSTHYSLGRSQPSLTQQKLSEKSVLAWVALGAVGLAGTLALGVFTAQRAGLWSTIPPNHTASPFPQEPDVLLAQIAEDLNQGDYEQASVGLEQVLAPETLARAEGNPLNQVLSLIDGHNDPQILFVKGRAYWQLYGLLDGELDSDIDPQKRATKNAALDQTITLWATLLEQRRSYVAGHVALGFAYYADLQTDQALEMWDKAASLEAQQRQARNEPASASVVNPIVLNAYAGLVLVHLNHAAVDIHEATADKERVLALEAFRDLQRSDSQGLLIPENLASAVTTDDNPHLWLWSSSIQTDWRAAYGKLLAELKAEEVGPN
jgi:tetratricopeptide (TPR) repeat protein